MQKRAPRTIGYGCVVPSGQTARQQRNRFKKADVDRVAIDPPGSSEEWDFMVRDAGPDLTLGEGDTLLLVCEAYLGYPGARRRARLEKLAKAGVKVAVIGGDPRVYDTEEKIKIFLNFARTTAMKDRGKVAAKAMGPGPGKPSKAALTQDQWDAVRHFWQTSRADRPAVVAYLQRCSAANGKPCEISDANLSDWFGKREENLDLKPPAGLIVPPKAKEK